MTKASFVLAAILLPVAAPALAAPPEPPMAFAVCRSCHSTEAGRNGVGPTLRGIVGSKAGAVPGYVFSPALKKSGIRWDRSEEHTSELQSLMRISYAVFCLKKKKT